MKLGSSVILLALIILSGYQQVKSQASSTYNGFDLVDKTGNIRKPTDFRDLYQALGVYTPVDFNGNTEMHYTYAPPGTAEYYRRTGKFADGTVLVKEVFATDHAQMTTGDAHWASKTKVWFVMIKALCPFLSSYISPFACNTLSASLAETTVSGDRQFASTAERVQVEGFHSQLRRELLTIVLPCWRLH